MPSTPAVTPADDAMIAFAIDKLHDHTALRVARMLAKQFEVTPEEAWRYVHLARAEVKGSLNGLDVRTDESLRNARIASRAETLSKLAADRGKFSAAGQLLGVAIRASAERSRLVGAHAPKQLELTVGNADEAPLQIDAILAILDEEGHAAMAVIMKQIEAAKADGRLVAVIPGPPAPLRAIDAAINEESEEN